MKLETPQFTAELWDFGGEFRTELEAKTEMSVWKITLVGADPKIKQHQSVKKQSWFSGPEIRLTKRPDSFELQPSGDYHHPATEAPSELPVVRTTLPLRTVPSL